MKETKITARTRPERIIKDIREKGSKHVNKKLAWV